MNYVWFLLYFSELLPNGQTLLCDPWDYASILLGCLLRAYGTGHIWIFSFIFTGLCPRWLQFNGTFRSRNWLAEVSLRNFDFGEITTDDKCLGWNDGTPEIKSTACHFSGSIESIVWRINYFWKMPIIVPQWVNNKSLRWGKKFCIP